MQEQSKHTNRLIDETSPYLLQHAHNPVDWYSWSDEAFEKARTEGKPLLVSIGYSACHWCHVMEHESFEDEATAKIMNENFVNIKVDMEERPDVDQIYMTFVQLTTGRGGWPMNVFITPDKLPFFGGTYFPPNPRYGMPSWQQILQSIAEAWRDRRDELTRSATDILGELRRVGISEFASEPLSTDLLDAAYKSFIKSFDKTNGGFGGAPKFPPSMSLDFLLRYWKRTGDEGALEIVKVTARKMAEGGMYDQLGGGFHRYSVDAVWLVPHFEKMLYDNAQLIRTYLHLFQIFAAIPGAGGDAEFFRNVAVQTIEYVKREMLDASGGFYSSQDADSEGEEGKFFVWTPAEVVSVIGDTDARVFNFFYDVSAEGNFEGQNILHVSYTAEAAAKALKIETEELETILERSRAKLFEHRDSRVKPFRDEKILTGWNGLMLAAFADAAFILGNDDYLSIAKRNADFLLDDLQKDGRLLRTWKDGRSKLNAYIEDYANLADGLIQTFQASGEIRYLEEAKRLADLMITEFWDQQNGGFFFTSNDHEELIVRNKDFYDNATPSGNSSAADVMLRLSKFYGEEKYERFATTVLRLAANQLKRYPQGFGRTLAAMEFHNSDVKEIVVIGDPGNELEKTVAASYLPSSVIASLRKSLSTLRLTADKEKIEGKSTAFVCENFVCQRPVTDVESLLRLLDE
ncbi:MAG: thioredoxin domain-containing protein [Acidobacteria bacterium]|nr:MAG: thioredoxin domain-containing protein [Acidobacteriota bacterium]